MLPFSLLLTGISFFLGAPLFAALGIGCAFICVFVWGLPMSTIGALMFAKINSWVMLAVPLFMLVGNMALAGGVAKRLLDFVQASLGHLPGGLLIGVVVFCTFFATLTGSPAAAVAAIGPIMVPAMLKRGYTPEVTGGIMVSAAQLGNIIPPSTTFIILSSLMEIPAATVFMAGVGPGLMISVLLIIVGTIVAIRSGFSRGEGASWRTRGSTLLKALPGLFIAVVILGGIYGGFMTPTEAAAVGGVYCIIVGLLVYRAFTRQSFWNAFVQTAKMTGLIFAIIAATGIFGYTISRLGTPQALIALLLQYDVSPLMFIFILMVAFAIGGFIMPPITVMMIMIPMLMPAFLALEVNLIWVAVLFTINVDFGGMTPPMAYMIYITAAIIKIPSEKIIRGVIPFCAVLLVVLFIVIFVPDIALWLPRLMGLYGA